MTTKDVKDLPDNLADLAKMDSFKEVDDQYTADELETELDEMGVGHLSNDRKAALVWRYMDAKNIEITNKPADTTEPESPAPVNDGSADPSPAPKPKSYKPASKPKQSSKKQDFKMIKVRNDGAFNVLEPASSTLLRAGETTTIAIKPHVSRDHVERNIKQLNITRGKTLYIVE